MKHLLIILSILLFSSPLFGHPKGEHTLYRWETSSGIQWREFGEKDIHPQYKGDVENGEPNGLGVIINTNKGKYVGEWKGGIKQGQGTFTYGKGKWDGEKYEGEFKDGVFHGQGTLTYPNGDKYVGEFRDGKINGQGTYTWSNGEKYVGEYKDEKKHGQGTLTLTDGNKYLGKFKNGKYYGQGTFYFSDG